YGVIGALILPAVLVVLLPNVPLIAMMILAQVINGMMLPVILLAILYLINKEKLMGQYVNSRFYNIICYSAVTVLIFVTLTMVGFTLLEIV
ncbi:Mn transporter, partial [Candidatus Woesearchaeota archaeon CG10_big_fil_rev_8_21_14_0_10_34_8]